METIRRTAFRRRLAVCVAACAVLGVGLVLVGHRWGVGDHRRLRVVAPGRLIGGAWQRPDDLETLLDRDRIRTIVTLTAINRDDPKYVGQAEVVGQTGVDWIIIPMRGSTATLEQMAEAADLLADPDRQPLFFHCVAGHHRTSLAHAAYLIRHAGYTAEAAWNAVASLPWSRPGAPADERDRARIVAFAAAQSSIPHTRHPARPEAVHAAAR